MANNGFITTSELDFQTYKTSLKEYLRQQDLFRDYDFDGSNLNVLLDILSYNTYNNAFYLNMIGSEMFLDSSALRESAISHAKELNYVPRSRNAACALVNLTLSVADTTTTSITIPKYFKFTTTIDGKPYIFTTNDSYIIRNTGTFQIEDMPIYEGRIITEQFTVLGGNKYIIASENIDINSLVISVQNSILDTDSVIYTRAYDLYGLDSESTVYFLQGYQANQYEIVFGNGITGRELVLGEIINITYRDCTADSANKASRFTPITSIDGVTTISATTSQEATSGAERETIDSIKFNAPRYFATQNRAVTKNDYISLVRANFPEIESINVFGGEELEQKKYGKVIVVTKPYGGEITSNSVKTRILNFLKNRTAVTITPIIQDADYFYLGIDTAVTYDTTLTSLNSSSIRTLVAASIQSYNDTYLNDFGNDFRYSRFVNQIDNADTSVISNETDVYLIKRINPIRSEFYTDIIYFQNEIYSQDITTRLPAGYISSVTSSLFTYYKNSVNYSARIADDGVGNLFVYTTDLGETRTILQDYAGTVDYTTGKVSLGSIMFIDYSEHIDIKVKVASKDILIERSQILQIDPADVSIEIVEN